MLLQKCCQFILSLGSIFAQFHDHCIPVFKSKLPLKIGFVQTQTDTVYLAVKATDPQNEPLSILTQTDTVFALTKQELPKTTFFPTTSRGEINFFVTFRNFLAISSQN